MYVLYVNWCAILSYKYRGQVNPVPTQLIFFFVDFTKKVILRFFVIFYKISFIAISLVFTVDYLGGGYYYY